MPCVPTYSGKLVDLCNPDPATIDILDIAWHLSGIRSWTGACHGKLSVAQRCVWVCDHVPIDQRRHALTCLLSDAHKAYLGELSDPAKGLLGRTWQMIEERLLDVIGRKLGVDLVHLPECVRQLHEVARATEARDLIRAPVSFAVAPHSQPIVVVSQELALAEFMNRFNLCGGNQRMADAQQPPDQPPTKPRRRKRES
jgi:hypothetical protein